MSPQWFNGPDQLSIITKLENEVVPEECLQESKLGISHRLLVGKHPNSINCVIPIRTYSKLKKLLRVTAYVVKFIAAIKGQASGELTPHDVSEVLLLWIKESQRSLVSSGKFNEHTRQLNPYCDQHGVWRCQGRLLHADLPVGTRHPILLDKTQYLTQLIVEDCHKSTKLGVSDTLVQIRTQYWILRGCQFVRKVIYKSVTCRRFMRKPFNPPPPLPLCRVQEAHPFCHTGVDFAGPLYVSTAVRYGYAFLHVI